MGMIYTTPQAAEALGIQSGTLHDRARRLRAAGKAIGHKVGSTWCYTPAEVRRLGRMGTLGRDK